MPLVVEHYVPFFLLSLMRLPSLEVLRISNRLARRQEMCLNVLVLTCSEHLLCSLDENERVWGPTEMLRPLRPQDSRILPVSS